MVNLLIKNDIRNYVLFLVKDIIEDLVAYSDYSHEMNIKNLEIIFNNRKIMKER